MTASAAAWMTDAAIALLRAEWARGTPAAAIGRLVGCSKRAIIGKASRLKLGQRRPSTVPRSTPAGKVASLPLALGPPGFDLPPFPPYVPVPDPPKPVIAAPEPRSEPASIVRSTPESCCWLSETRPFRACAAPTFGRLPYCEEHARQAYASDRWRYRNAAGEPAHASGGDD
jgi:GcrA cell cycle regulator